MCQRLFQALKILILCVFFLSMVFAVLSTKSVNAMTVEYPSLKPYWFLDNSVNFSMYLFNLFKNNFYWILLNKDKIKIGL